jgi:hypothetical protein
MAKKIYVGADIVGTTDAADIVSGTLSPDRIPSGIPIGVDAKTANYTLVASDAGKLITMSNTAARTITIPTNASVAFPTGTIIYVSNINTGAVTIAGASGVTVSSTSGDRVLRRQFSAGMCIKTGTNTWLFQHTTRDAGIGSNVVQTVKTNTFTTTSTSFATATGLSVSITPSSTASKVLLIAQLSVGMNSFGSPQGQWRFSGGNSTTYVGGAAGSRTRAVWGGFGRSGIEDTTRPMLLSFSMVVLDSPATASSVTYNVQVKTPSGTVHLNKSSEDSDTSSYVRGASSITAIEVAA